MHTGEITPHSKTVTTNITVIYCLKFIIITSMMYFAIKGPDTRMF